MMRTAIAERKNLKIAALLVALITIGVGLAGVVATDSATALRRLYFATPARFYATGAVRLAMGLVLILAASSSRWRRTMRVFGSVMCLQAVVAEAFGLERARTIMEWETMQGPALLRAGAVVAVASGVFLAVAFTERPSNEHRAFSPGAFSDGLSALVSHCKRHSRPDVLQHRFAAIARF